MRIAYLDRIVLTGLILKLKQLSVLRMLGQPEQEGDILGRV